MHPASLPSNGLTSHPPSLQAEPPGNSAQDKPWWESVAPAGQQAFNWKTESAARTDWEDEPGEEETVDEVAGQARPLPCFDVASPTTVDWPIPLPHQRAYMAEIFDRDEVEHMAAH